MADNNPFDLNQWFGQFNVPGLDVSDLVEQSRKDWEALQEANRTAMEGWQKLAQRQNELMQQVVQDWQKDLMDSVGRPPGESAERFRESIETGMHNMRELAEIIAESQNEAGEILRRRVEENIQRMSGGAGEDKDQ